MTLVLPLLALLVLAAALCAVPFLLPWPRRLRWMIATQRGMHPLEVGCLDLAIPLDEVSVLGVLAKNDELIISLLPVAADGLLVRTAPKTPTTVELLEAWAATVEPLLLLRHGDGSESLDGRRACVTGLRDLAVRPAAPSAQPSTGEDHVPS